MPLLKRDGIGSLHSLAALPSIKCGVLNKTFMDQIF